MIDDYEKKLASKKKNLAKGSFNKFKGMIKSGNFKKNKKAQILSGAFAQLDSTEAALNEI